MNCNINNNDEYLKGIEKSILSTLIHNADYNKIIQAESILEIDDFYEQQHGLIFKSIMENHNNDLTIDKNTVYLNNKNKIDDKVYKEVINTEPVESIIDYLTIIRKDSLHRKIKNIAGQIEDGNIHKIIDLQVLNEKLQSLNESNILKPFTDDFEAYIKTIDLDVEKIKNLKLEYLYDEFIVKNDIVMIAALPGLGKSLISISLCNMFLEEKKIKRVFYVDADNGGLTVKERNIHMLKEKFGNRLNYFYERSKSEYFNFLNRLNKRELNDCFIVVDSVKHIIDGDRNSHKDVTETMEILKKLRKSNATILFLHHQNKKTKDFNSEFAGSSAFAEDVASAFKLKKNEDKNTYILTPIKDRNNVSTSIAFTYNDDNTLNRVPLDFALETNEDIAVKEEIISFIKSCEEKPNYSQILKNLVENGFNKDKSNLVIQNGKDKFWKATRYPRQNNKLLFELIDKQDN